MKSLLNRSTEKNIRFLFNIEGPGDNFESTQAEPESKDVEITEGDINKAADVLNNLSATSQEDAKNSMETSDPKLYDELSTMGKDMGDVLDTEEGDEKEKKNNSLSDTEEIKESIKKYNESFNKIELEYQKNLEKLENINNGLATTVLKEKSYENLGTEKMSPEGQILIKNDVNKTIESTKEYVNKLTEKKDKTPNDEVALKQANEKLVCLKVILTAIEQNREIGSVVENMDMADDIRENVKDSSKELCSDLILGQKYQHDVAINELIQLSTNGSSEINMQMLNNSVALGGYGTKFSEDSRIAIANATNREEVIDALGTALNEKQIDYRDRERVIRDMGIQTYANGFIADRGNGSVNNIENIKNQQIAALGPKPTLEWENDMQYARKNSTDQGLR